MIVLKKHPEAEGSRCCVFCHAMNYSSWHLFFVGSSWAVPRYLTDWNLWAQGSAVCFQSVHSEVTEQVQCWNLNKYWQFMLISSYPPHKYESLYHTDPITCEMKPNGTKHPILREKLNTSSISTQRNQFT